METVLGVMGMAFGLVLKSLFQVEFMGWLRRRPSSWWRNLLLYGDSPAAEGSTAASQPQKVSKPVR